MTVRGASLHGHPGRQRVDGRLKGRWGNKVVIVESPTNLGVGSGYNRGVERGLELGAGPTGVFNNDILVDSGLVSAMVVPHIEDEMVTLTSPITMYYDNQWQGVPTYVRGTIAGIRAFLIDRGETRER